MAFLYITEFNKGVVAGLNTGSAMAMPAPLTPPIAEQRISIGGASTQSAVFNAATKFIMVHTDAICSLAFGVNPVAVNSAQRMAANETRFYGVTAGNKLAVISNT